jgi:hypothetical protein
LAGGQSPNWARRVGAIGAILLGAAIGAFLVVRTGLVIPLILAGVLGLGGSLACALHPAAATPHRG